MSNILDFFKGKFGQQEDALAIPDYGSSGNYDPAPFVFVPRTEYQSSSGDYSALPGEIAILKEAGRALLEELDDLDGWMDAAPNPDVVERFRALVERE